MHNSKIACTTAGMHRQRVIVKLLVDTGGGHGFFQIFVCRCFEFQLTGVLPSQDFQIFQHGTIAFAGLTFEDTHFLEIENNLFYDHFPDAEPVDQLIHRSWVGVVVEGDVIGRVVVAGRQNRPGGELGVVLVDGVQVQHALCLIVRRRGQLAIDGPCARRCGGLQAIR